MSSSQLDERLPPSDSPPLLASDPTAEALQNNLVLSTIFSQLLDDPAALAQLSVCACECTAWRDAAADPRLWTSLTAWKRLPGLQISQPLDGGEPEPTRAAEEEAGEDRSFDSDSDMMQRPLPVPQDDAYAKMVTRAVLRRLVSRSKGQLRRLDATPLGLARSDVIRALDGQGLEGQLESLCVDGVDIEADLSSLSAFKKCLASGLEVTALCACLFRNASPCAHPNEAGILLARGDPEKGLPPDERFAAYLDDPPAASAAAAAAIYMQRVHAKLASFLRKP